MKIDINNYEEYFISYMENELSPEVREEVELFVAQHPNLQSELEAFKMTVLQPDKSVSFSNKEVLLKKGNGNLVALFTAHWLKIAAAILLIVGMSIPLYYSSWQNNQVQSAQSFAPHKNQTMASPIVNNQSLSTPSLKMVKEKRAPKAVLPSISSYKVNNLPVLAVQDGSPNDKLVSNNYPAPMEQQVILPIQIKQTLNPETTPASPVANIFTNDKMIAHVPVKISAKTKRIATLIGLISNRIVQSRQNEEPLIRPDESIHLALGNFSFTHIPGN